MSVAVGRVPLCSTGRCWPGRLRSRVLHFLRLEVALRREWVMRDLDVHHVVAAGSGSASLARSVLERWGVDIDDLPNAAILPRGFHQRQGLHRHAYLRAVNHKLLSADFFAGRVAGRGGFVAGRLIITKTLQGMGDELVLRSGDLMALRLQGMLRPVQQVAGGGTAEGFATTDACAGGLAGDPGGVDECDEAVPASGGYRLPLASSGGRGALAEPERRTR